MYHCSIFQYKHRSSNTLEIHMTLLISHKGAVNVIYFEFDHLQQLMTSIWEKRDAFDISQLFLFHERLKIYGGMRWLFLIDIRLERILLIRNIRSSHAQLHIMLICRGSLHSRWRAWVTFSTRRPLQEHRYSLWATSSSTRVSHWCTRVPIDGSMWVYFLNSHCISMFLLTALALCDI